MKTLLFVHLWVSIVSVLLVFYIVNWAANEYLRKKGLLNEETKKYKFSFGRSETFLFILCMIPVLNIVLILIVLFQGKNLKKKVFDEIEKQF